jgi:hypothetical protein
MTFQSIGLIHDHCDIVFHEGEGPPAREEFLNAITDKDGIICLVSDRMDRKAVDRAAHLKVMKVRSLKKVRMF